MCFAEGIHSTKFIILCIRSMCNNLINNFLYFSLINLVVALRQLYFCFLFLFFFFFYFSFMYV
jgi:protein-S-isoprenylcysteine O-methyltransferase Ste14